MCRPMALLPTGPALVDFVCWLMEAIARRREDFSGADRDVGKQRRREAVGVLGAALEEDPAADVLDGAHPVVPLGPEPAGVGALAERRGIAEHRARVHGMVAGREYDGVDVEVPGPV